MAGSMTAMRKTTYILAGAAFALCLSGGLFAQDNSADLFADMGSADSTAGTASAAATAASPSEGDFTLKLSGTHDFNYHFPMYWDDGNKTYANANSPEVKKPTFTNDVGIEVRDGNLKLVSRWGLNATPVASDASNPNSSWAASATLKPLENYVSWSPANYKLSFGYQIFSWGVADRKNPTDNLNPKDYTVGVNPDKIPVLAADAVWYASDKLSVEGVAIPLKPVSQYPEDFAGLIESKAKLLSQTVSPSYENSSEPKNLVAGAKVNYNSSGVDLSLDYLYDIDQFYTPEISTVATGLPAGYPQYKMSTVMLERKRIHRFGGDAKTTIGKFGLWLESAYSLTGNDGSDDYSARKSRLDYTLGGDVNYGPNDTFYVNVQYIGTWIPGYDKDFNATADIKDIYTTQAAALEYYQRAMVNSLGLETEGLMQGVTCNMKWELADALVTPQVTTVYTMPFMYDKTNETRYGALVVNPEVDLKPVDSFHIKFGADLYYAWHKVTGNDKITLDTASNAIGAYTPSNNVYLKVEYKWNANVKK